MRIRVEHLWDGRPAEPRERVALDLDLDADGLHLRVDAPLHGDPAPDAPPGPCWGLWDYEVVELFILGPEARYTEIEIGPHGHHLVLQLHGRRALSARELPLELSVARVGARWTADARLDGELLPPTPWHFNAYAIHGAPPERRYLAHAPVPGDAPDFHRLDAFVPLTLRR